MAGRQGFEPWLTESESVVLPLDDLPKTRVDYTYFFLRVKQKPESGKFMTDKYFISMSMEGFSTPIHSTWTTPYPVCIILFKQKNHPLLIFI